MFIALQVTLPATDTPIALPLKDLLTVKRAEKNIYPPIKDFCRYLSLSVGPNISVSVVGDPTTVLDGDAGFILTPETPLVLADWAGGMVPLGEVYLTQLANFPKTIRVLLVQD